MIFSDQNLMSAWNKVKDNRGCAGTDCVTIEDFALDLGCNCSLKLPPGGYPSPVLHAFRRQNKWLFQPLSSAKGSAKEEGNKVIRL